MTEGKHPLELLANWIEEDTALTRHIEDSPIPRPPEWFREFQVRQSKHYAAQEELLALDPAALRALALSAPEAP